MEKIDIARNYLDVYAIKKDAIERKQVLIDMLAAQEDPAANQVHTSLQEECREQEEALKRLETAVIELLESIPDGDGKTALIMHYICGMSYRDIAAKVYVSERNLNRKVNAALEEIGALMASGRTK